MNRALWLLIGLQLRGWGRFLVRSLRTVKGALLALVGLFVFVPWLLTALTAGAGPGFDPDTLRRSGPALLLLYCLMNVLTSSGEKAIYFAPAEVNFLFCGPFGRREVLAYKIIFTLLAGLPTTLILVVVFRPRVWWFPAAYWGALLIFAFMQLFAMVLNLGGITVGERLYTRGRKLLLASLVVLIGVVLFQAAGSPSTWRPRELLEQAAQTPVWRVVSLPLSWFFEAFLATRFWPDLVLYGLLGLAVDLALLGVVFALDAHYLETAASASARVYARIQRMRGRSVEGAEVEGRKVRLAIPGLPWWGGIGPIFWRQLTIALRGMGRLLLVLGLLGLVLAGPLVSAAGQGKQDTPLVVAVAGIVLWMTIFLTPLFPFDFRGDVDRLALLKTLPIRPWRLTIGQLLTPVLLLSGLQCLALAVVLAASPESQAIVLACAAFTVPFNFLLFALENLLFLLFPTRLVATTPGDFQALGRNFLFMMTKITTLLVVAVLSVAVAGLTWVLTGGRVELAQQGGLRLVGGSRAWAVAAAWPVVALGGLALVPLVAWAFTLFDVGRDTPP